MGILLAMKRFAASAAALIFLATAAPVLAQDRDDRYNHDNGYNQRDDRYNHDNHDRDRDSHRYTRDYYRDRNGHEWHQGDMYRGHRLTYYNNAWGYWQPRNGSQFFVQFSL